MVNVADIKAAIADRELDIKSRFEKGKIIRRELSLPNMPLHPGVANIITGVRRCGKSTLAMMLPRGMAHSYVNFEDERLRGMDSSELNKVLEALHELKGPDIGVLVFDEIQNIVGWESFVSRITESKVVVVTGSNARLLSKELATALTGRHVDHELFPFSFREYLEYIGLDAEYNDTYITAKKARLMLELLEYVRYGGFVYFYGRNGDAQRSNTLLLTLYRDIIERDIVQRHGIKMTEKLRELARYSIANITSVISYNNAAKLIGIKSTQTALNWMSYLQNAYLLIALEKYSPKLKERTIAPKKIFCIDNGIANSISPELFGQDGRLMENTVAIELLRRRSYSKNRQEISYWRDYSDNEVDFVVRYGNRVEQLIQVTDISSAMEVKRRETGALLKASEILKCRNLVVITWDYEAEQRIEGKKIVFIPLLRWLLKYKT
ncbi:MAG: ATP-binding protein [Candidatus Marsarchaeota archaeon]|nr:ATP-binding protein [Candidatus Marsarchaeota archaeon]MCL5412867.1 ATP-binding protein [Candidatus Marsarchaeota archaeon]